MQVLNGTKREITLFLWNEKLEKAKKKLENSIKCYKLYGDDDSRQWIEEDAEAVEKIEQKIKEVAAYMDKHEIN